MEWTIGNKKTNDRTGAWPLINLSLGYWKKKKKNQPFFHDPIKFSILQNQM